MRPEQACPRQSSAVTDQPRACQWQSASSHFS
jgi:hypothetical protein